jgi:hypothetical protein
MEQDKHCLFDTPKAAQQALHASNILRKRLDMLSMLYGLIQVCWAR